jgi:hypothetical protein
MFRITAEQLSEMIARLDARSEHDNDEVLPRKRVARADGAARSAPASEPSPRRSDSARACRRVGRPV